MSSNDSTPDINTGATAEDATQQAFDMLGPPGSTLLFDQVKPSLLSTLNKLLKEMRKKHYHLVKRRTLSQQMINHLTMKTFPSNLQSKLAPQNFPSTIDEKVTANYNKIEQATWIKFKTHILEHRAAVIAEDLRDLEVSFNLYSDANYIQERFITISPAIRPHANVIHGLVLSFSVSLQELINKLPVTRKRAKRSASSNTSVCTAATSDDDMTVDDDSTPSRTYTTGPSSSTSSTSPSASSASSSASTSSSSSSSSSSSVSSSKSTNKSLQEQINQLTRLVKLSLQKNSSGNPPQKGGPAPSNIPTTNPTTPRRMPRLSSTQREPVSQEPSHKKPPSTTPQHHGKSSMKAHPTQFHTTFQPTTPAPPTPGPWAPNSYTPAFYGNPFGHFPPYTLEQTPQANTGLPYLHHYPHPQYHHGTYIPRQTTLQEQNGFTPDFARKQAPGNRGRSSKAPPVRFAAFSAPRAL